MLYDKASLACYENTNSLTSVGFLGEIGGLYMQDVLLHVNDVTLGLL